MDSRYKRVLVTGASGFVGSHLCRELCAHGYDVTVLHRSSSKLEALKDLPIKFALGDVTDAESLHQAAAEVDAIFHIAAVYREAKFPDSYYFEVNTEGTRKILEIAEKRNIRLIHCSTIGVHSDMKRLPANEDEPYSPSDVYQESKCQAEKLVLDAAAKGRVKATIIRPAMIWGPGDRRIFKLFKGVAEGTLPIIGTGKTMCHWVSVSDLVRAFRLALETDASIGRLYIIAGERAVTLRHTYESIADCFGVRVLPIRVPALPLKLLGGIVEVLCRPFGVEPPIYRRRVDFFSKSRAFDCSRARNELRYKPALTMEDEVRLIADWYYEQGWIKRRPVNYVVRTT